MPRSEISYPRLLYWADVPVNPTRAGPMLMHRLLGAWPADKLMVVTPNAKATCDLPGVLKVESPPPPLPRLLKTRFRSLVTTALGAKLLLGTKLSRGAPPKWLARHVQAFAPQAVLTVGVSAAWIGADGLAKHLGIPLHLIVHDDHQYAEFWCRPLKNIGEKLFGQAYRRASSRFCISRPMELEYERRFGVPGDVLLPFRDAQPMVFTQPRPIAGGPVRPAKIFYAGSTTRKGFRLLDEIAGILKSKGHRLIFYLATKSPQGFTPRHIERRAPLPAAQLVERLHEDADLLLLYTDFEPATREVVKTLFPSKLVDYTASAVPILVVAPEYASVVDYLQSRPEAGELVTENDPEIVASAIERLLADPERRRVLAEGAAVAGLEDFDHGKAFELFTAALSRGWRTDSGNQMSEDRGRRSDNRLRIADGG